MRAQRWRQVGSEAETEVLDEGTGEIGRILFRDNSDQRWSLEGSSPR